MSVSQSYRNYHADLDPFTLYEYPSDKDTATASAGGSNAQTGISGALPALGHAVSGCAGAVISRTLLYPLDLLITRMQSGRERKKTNVLEELRTVFEREGVAGLYVGLKPELAKTAIDSFLFFLSYTSLQQYRKSSIAKSKSQVALPADLQSLAANNGSVKERLSVKISVLDDIMIGILAGAFSKLVTTPLATVVSKQQMSKARSKGKEPVDEKNHDKPKEKTVEKSTIQTLLSTPPSELWAGYPFALLLTINPALTFLAQSILLRLLQPAQKKSKPHPVLMFFVAALSKALASLVTYPLGFARTRALNGGSPQGKSFNIPQVGSLINTTLRKLLYPILFTWNIAQEEGLASLYTGVTAEVFKGFLSHGFTMLSKSRIHSLVVRLYWIAAGIPAREGGIRLISSAETKGSLGEANRAEADEDDVGDIVDEVSKSISDK